MSTRILIHTDYSTNPPTAEPLVVSEERANWIMKQNPDGTPISTDEDLEAADKSGPAKQSSCKNTNKRSRGTHTTTSCRLLVLGRKHS